MFEKKPIKKSSPKTTTSQRKTTRTPVKKRTLKRTYTRKKIQKFKKNPGKYALRAVIYLFLIFIALSFVISIILYNKYIKDLPSVDELQSYEFAEASTIYDRN
jgi:polyferredoxin